MAQVVETTVSMSRKVPENIGVYTEIVASPFITFGLGDPETKVYTDLRLKTGNSQDFKRIRSECLDSGVNFIDPEFPHTDESIGLNYATVKQEDIDEGWGPKMIWVRIKDIIPKLDGFNGDEVPIFSHDVKSSSIFSKFDVNQGSIGDCWFLSALASVATNQKLINYFVYSDNQDPENLTAGIFHFKFWYQGIYVDIVVDDYLPVWTSNESYKLLSCKIVKNGKYAEFWTALAEKAFAKLNGNYDIIDGGYPNEGLEAITGGFSDTVKLNSLSADIFSKIRLNIAGNLFLCLSNFSKEKGLVSGHAYSITEVATLNPVGKKPVNLVRIRNPWGFSEWTGAWSDGDETNWKSVPIKEQKLRVDKDDGEFWMSYDDCVKYFTSLYSVVTVEENEIFGNSPSATFQAFHGTWSNEIGSNGGPDKPWENPQYLVEVTSSLNICTLAVGVTCKSKLKSYHAIGAYVYKVNDPTRDQPFLQDDFKLSEGLSLNTNQLKNVDNSPNFRRNKTISQFFSVKPGKYLIVPFTNEQTPLEFCVRIKGTAQKRV